MRRFHLQRDHDASGVSGTGVVAEGVEFSDGVCALRWRTGTASTAIYASAEDLVTIHGHQGATRLVWRDPLGGCDEVAYAPPVLPEALARRIRIIDRLRRAYP